MKKTHIIAILVIASAIAIIVSTAGDASTYVTFDQAFQMASSGNKNHIHVVGELKKGEGGNIIGLQKSTDNLSFSFVNQLFFNVNNQTGRFRNQIEVFTQRNKIRLTFSNFLLETADIGDGVLHG